MSNELTPKIEQTPAVIDFDYETFKAQLEQRLAQYRTVVTADTVKQAKATATELNKLKTDLDDKRKAAIKYVSAPIKAADEQMKDCVKLVADGRQEILDQVAKFDQERLEQLKTLLANHRDRTRDDAQINNEFYGAASDLSDLHKLGNLTATGNLTAKATTEVDERVNAELQLQQTVERRILELENACYKAGLAQPLQREHVDHFLKADTDTYQAKLQQLIDVEVQRQQQAEAAMRQRVEREQAEQHAERQRNQERQQRLDEQQESQGHQDEPVEIPAPAGRAGWEDDAGLFGDQMSSGYAAPDPVPEQSALEAKPAGGSDQFTLTVTMTATLPAGMSEDDVREQFRAFIQGPGNVSVDWITVERDAQEDAA